MALQHILWKTLIIISPWKPPANVSLISATKPTEGELKVVSFPLCSFLFEACRPLYCLWFIRAGNWAEGLDVKGFALFMCGI